MKRLLLVATGICVLGAGTQGAKPSPPVPVKASFAPGALSHEGGGDYFDGVNCVASTYVTPSGDYSFRTASHTVNTCEVDGGPWDREVTLDLGDQVEPSPLVDCSVGPVPAYTGWNVCGNNIVEDARLGAPGLFAAGATSSSVTIYFSQRPDLNNTEFVLTYRQPLVVSGSVVRILRNGPSASSAYADLHRAVPKLNRKGQLVGYSYEWLGIWNVPFELTATP